MHAKPEYGDVLQTAAQEVARLLVADGVSLFLREGAEWERKASHGDAFDGSSPLEHEVLLLDESDHAADAVAVSERVLRIGHSKPVLAGRFRTGHRDGALLVELPADHDPAACLDLLKISAHTTALMISNTELYSTASAQAFELQQVLDISAELGGAADLDEFLRQFVVRAAEFLGFQRAYIALVEGGVCRMRWGTVDGKAQPMNVDLKTKVTETILYTREAWWSDDVEAEPDADLELSRRFKIKQYLAVPLLDAEHKVLGLFGVTHRPGNVPISPEDVRRAKALAAQAAVALVAAKNLHLSEEHRKRAEHLVNLGLQLNASLRLPDFIRNFAQRAAETLGAGAAALALAQGPVLETVVLHDRENTPERALQWQLTTALREFMAEGSEFHAGSAAEILGARLASALQWQDVAIVRLKGSDDELLGFLCLANLRRTMTPADKNLTQALGSHAAVALENTRLFSRMTQANKQWAEIFDAISDFIVVHNDANKVLRVNRSLAEFVGVQASELVGLSMRALIAITTGGGDQPCPFCRIGVDAADEYIHPVLERTYLVSTSRVRGALNEGLQTIHILKDITDRREAERRYRELFDTVQEGIFFSTPQGKFEEVNDAFVKILGYQSRQELLQVDIGTALYRNPEDRARFQRAIEEQGFLRNFEEVFKRPDGSLVYTLQNSFAVRDASGKVMQYRGVIFDITELKNYQAQLLRERDFNSKILNHTQSLILVADTAGLISYANRRCFESGTFQETHLLGNRLGDLVAPSRRNVFNEAFELLLAGHLVDNLELPIVRADNRLGQFSVNMSPMRDEHGAVTSVVVVMTDITETALLNAKLMHAEKMAAVGQLVSGVAHEVNNPLTAVLGFADLLMENPDVPPAARKDLEVIVQEAQRTKNIVQNLLSFARQTPAERKLVRLHDILRRTLQLRSYDFASHSVNVHHRIEGELPEVLGDPHQLQQVFLNIVNNAYDAIRETGRDGEILISTEERDGFVFIRFRDNGTGISHPDRIFDPFFTTKEVGKGTGLGLSICYGIVREHGGDIICENNEDAGATFTIKLPAAARVLAVAVGGER